MQQQSSKIDIRGHVVEEKAVLVASFNTRQYTKELQENQVVWHLDNIPVTCMYLLVSLKAGPSVNFLDSPSGLHASDTS